MENFDNIIKKRLDEIKEVIMKQEDDLCEKYKRTHETIDYAVKHDIDYIYDEPAVFETFKNVIKNDADKNRSYAITTKNLVSEMSYMSYHVRATLGHDSTNEPYISFDNYINDDLNPLIGFNEFIVDDNNKCITVEYCELFEDSFLVTTKMESNLIVAEKLIKILNSAGVYEFDEFIRSEFSNTDSIDATPDDSARFTNPYRYLQNYQATKPLYSDNFNDRLISMEFAILHCPTKLMMSIYGNKMARVMLNADAVIEIENQSGHDIEYYRNMITSMLDMVKKIHYMNDLTTSLIFHNNDIKQLLSGLMDISDISDTIDMPNVIPGRKEMSRLEKYKSNLNNTNTIRKICQLYLEAFEKEHGVSLKELSEYFHSRFDILEYMFNECQTAFLLILNKTFQTIEHILSENNESENE